MGRTKFQKIIDPRHLSPSLTGNNHPYTGFLELPDPDSLNHEPIVYYLTNKNFISYGSAIKIGSTNNLGRRMRQMRNSRKGLDPLVLAIEPGDHGCGTEFRRHREFDVEKVSGEYFWPSIALVEHINECFDAARDRLPIPGVTYTEFE